MSDLIVVRDAVSRFGMHQLHLVSNQEIDVDAVMTRWLGEGQAEVAFAYEEIGMWHLKLYWRVEGGGRKKGARGKGKGARRAPQRRLRLEVTMASEMKPWKCPGGHVMGMTTRNGRGIGQLLLYRHPIDPEAEEPAEVDIIGRLEGLMLDVRCEICGNVRTWVPGEEALRRMLQRAGRMKGEG